MRVDVLVLGAGPAGMSAALEARAQGLSVLLLDENAAPGGQVYRGARADARGPGADQARAGAKPARQGASRPARSSSPLAPPSVPCPFQAGRCRA